MAFKLDLKSNRKIVFSFPNLYTHFTLIQLEVFKSASVNTVLKPQ